MFMENKKYPQNHYFKHWKFSEEIFNSNFETDGKKSFA